MPLMLKSLFSSWLPVAIVVTCVILVPWYSYRKGLEHGRLEVMADIDKQTIGSLKALIANHENLIAEANQASNQWLAISRTRAVQDQLTTNTLQELLNETAELRTACTYDANVMRHLNAARDRAAKAAASGLNAALSGASSHEQ